MLTDEQAREMTRRNLQKDLIDFLDNYMIIYDKYYNKETTENEKYEAYRLKELADGLIGIFAIFEVYARDGRMYADYALEKINSSKSYIDNFKEYYELLKEETSE